MKIEPEANCPLDSFNPCRQMKCAWFMKVSGAHPQTGNEIEEWGCSMGWIPILLIENAQQQRQTATAVESFRNEMVKSTEVSNQILLAAAQQNLLEVK